jgi:glycosyltransferase involved in cell wall biosynthesis
VHPCNPGAQSEDAPDGTIRNPCRAGLADRRSAPRGIRAVTGPGVTAVIPAYNMEAFVGRTLASALGQTYPHLEIIVVDDGSTDRTRAIVEKMAAGDPRVRVVSVENGGLAAARNLGTHLSTTPYVAYLDADDLWHSEKIARQIAALSVHGHESEWAGCYALSRFIDLADRVLDNGPSADARGDFFEQHLYRNHLGNGSCLLVRRDAVLAIGGFDPEHALRGLGGEDYDFQLRLLRRYKLEVVRQFLVGYRVYRGQMSDAPTRMARARLMTIEAALSDGKLPHDDSVRAMAHARIVSAYRALRARAWWAGGVGLAGALAATPLATLGLIFEMAAIFLRRPRRAPASVSQAPPVPFAEFAPADGVAATDDINQRPRTRVTALRLRSAVPEQAAEAPEDRIAADRFARIAK